MKKIFTIYNPVLESDTNGIEISIIEKLYNVIRKYWNVEPSQIQFDYNEYTKLYDVRLTSKIGEIFALIGNIHFNFYE